MNSTQLATQRVWTYSDYAALDDGRRYQVIHGELIVYEPAPSIYHQTVSRELAFLMINHARSNDLGNGFYAPVDVILDDHNVVQPDLIFVRKSNSAIIQSHAIVGTPDMVVEILSPSTGKLDRTSKLKLYERAGVEEYWIINPTDKSIEVLVLVDHCYMLFSKAVQNGTVDSKVLRDFRVDVKSIFM